MMVKNGINKITKGVFCFGLICISFSYSSYKLYAIVVTNVTIKVLNVIFTPGHLGNIIKLVLRIYSNLVV